jgi:hypothetical protein
MAIRNSPRSRHGAQSAEAPIAMMVSIMKWAATLLCCLNLAAAAELTGGRTVYLMPMGHSLDQFIANRLTRMHVLQVVTDPAKADTIFTDQVGEALEDKLKDLYPPPPSPEAKEAAKEKEAAAKEKAEKPGAPPANGPGSLLADTVNKVDKAGSMGVSGRGRGTIFLVDVKSRQVLWSAFEKPRNSSPNELDHTAERVVKQLKEDLSPKTK